MCEECNFDIKFYGRLLGIGKFYNASQRSKDAPELNDNHYPSSHRLEDFALPDFAQNRQNLTVIDRSRPGLKDGTIPLPVGAFALSQSIQPESRDANY